MARPRRRSVRLWQTELFIIVTVVAILVLSVSLSSGLQRTLKQLGEEDQLTHASALATSLSPEYPLTVESLSRVRSQIDQFRSLYEDEVWLYDIDGTLREATAEDSLPQDLLEEAFIVGLADSPPYTHMDIEQGGHVVAATAVYDPDGRRAAVVVLSGSVTDSLSVLDAVRSQLWTTFWVALIASGGLGFAFAEFIGRRVRLMQKAATAIADGDFEQRLPIGPVPDEIQELAESYNRMAMTLGDAFSALRDREEEIATVVESLGEGVIALDKGGSVRVMNPQSRRLLGLPEGDESLVGSDIREISDDGPTLELVDKSLLGSDVSGVVTLEERTVLLHSTPISPEPGRVDGAVLLMSDITERHRLEEAQREFVANASHEMRTPIAAVKGLLELLTDGAAEVPDIRDDFLRTMTLEVDRLGRLVADLLTLAQLDSGGLRLDIEPIDVTGLLDDIATVMRPLADNSEVELLIEGPKTPVEVMGDRDRVTQVLVGFVDNALKHSVNGKTVTLGTRATPGSIVFAVHNEGIGIDPEVVPRLFDRFFRADESRAMPKGAGLGLSIAKEIIEAHGSVVMVDSQPGEGATFSFVLPTVHLENPNGASTRP